MLIYLEIKEYCSITGSFNWIRSIVLEFCLNQIGTLIWNKKVDSSGVAVS